MNQVKEVSVSKCPVKLEVCFPTCYFWRSGKCEYEAIIAGEESIGHLATLAAQLSKPSLKLLIRLADLLVKEEGG